MSTQDTIRSLGNAFCNSFEASFGGANVRNARPTVLILEWFIRGQNVNELRLRCIDPCKRKLPFAYTYP